MSLAMSTKSVLAKRFRYLILWLGLILCAAVIWNLQERFVEVFREAGFVTIVGWFLLLMAAWLLYVSAWRSIIAAFFLRSLAWRAAARQSGLLLVGKYIPGGIFGFLIRVSDARTGESRWRHVIAGVYEQVGILAITLSTGLIFMIASRYGMWSLICLVLVPALVALAMSAAAHIFGWIVREKPGAWIRGISLARPCKVQIHRFLSLSLASILAWMVLATWIALSGFSQPLHAAIGLAGAFGVSVTAGLMAVFAPGGIGVREAAFISMATWWLPLPDAVGMAVVLRLASVVFDLAAGTIAAFLKDEVLAK